MAKKMTAQDLNKILDEKKLKQMLAEKRLESAADENTQTVYKAEVITLGKEITELEQEIQDLLALEENANVEKKWNQQKSFVKTVVEQNYMGYFPTEGKFIYCRDYGKDVSNVQFKVFPETRIVRVLSKLGGFNIEQRDYHKVIDYFQDIDKVFLETTSSFNRNKWDETDIYNKMTVIRDHWVEPDYANAESYDPKFDILTYCVAGGKEENIQHLEQWVAFKYLNPNKNAMIPNLDIGGNPGGNGKGRFVELLKTIFTNACVVQAHKDELDKFNSAWEMAVVLYYDEPEEKELAASKLKQATGAEDMRVEKKGIDATMADRNYNFIFLSNNENGVVRLSGGSDGGEDRRYSVMTTDLVLLDVLMDSGLGYEASRNFLDDIAQDLIKNRTEVAKWLAHIITKHRVQDMPSLPALHGTDYHRRFEEQKDNITEAFDAILPVFLDQQILPQNILGDLVRVRTGNHQHKDHNVMVKFKSYLSRNKVAYSEQDRAKYHITNNGDRVDTMQRKCLRIKDTTTNEFNYRTICNVDYVKGGKTKFGTDILTEMTIIV